MITQEKHINTHWNNHNLYKMCWKAIQPSLFTLDVANLWPFSLQFSLITLTSSTPISTPELWTCNCSPCPLHAPPHSVRLLAPSCGDDQFACGDGMCIFKDAKCDGFADCSDASDEKGCGMFFKTLRLCTHPYVCQLFPVNEWQPAATCCSDDDNANVCG